MDPVRFQYMKFERNGRIHSVEELEDLKSIYALRGCCQVDFEFSGMEGKTWNGNMISAIIRGEKTLEGAAQVEQESTAAKGSQETGVDEVEKKESAEESDDTNVLKHNEKDWIQDPKHKLPSDDSATFQLDASPKDRVEEKRETNQDPKAKHPTEGADQDSIKDPKESGKEEIPNGVSSEEVCFMVDGTKRVAVNGIMLTLDRKNCTFCVKAAGGILGCKTHKNAKYSRPYLAAKEPMEQQQQQQQQW
jgi:hypothetical protein